MRRPVARPQADGGTSQRPADRRGETTRARRDAHRSLLATGRAEDSERAEHAVDVPVAARLPSRDRGDRPRDGGGPRHGGRRAPWRRGRRVGIAGRSSRSGSSSSARSSSTRCCRGRRRAARPPGRGALPDRRVLARRGRGPDAPRPGLRLRAAPPARARRDHSPRGERRRGLRLVQGRERALLRADGGARVPPRPAARLRLVGGLAAALSVAIPSSISVATVMTESLSYLTTAWALYAIAIALERPTVLRQFAVLADGRRRVLHTDRSSGSSTSPGSAALACPLAARARGRGRGRGPTSSGSGRRRCRVVLGAARVRRAARLRQLGHETRSARTGCSGAGYDPFAGRQVVRLPPRGLRRLPRGRSGRRRADRALGARARREGGLAAGGAHSWRCSARRTSPGCSSSPPSRARPWGYDRLHDRYGFYLVPLWLVGLVVLARLRPAPAARRVRDRVVAALALALILPVRAACERGRDRHRPRRALGAGRGRARGARAGIGPPRARALRRSRCWRRRSSCRGASRGWRCRRRWRSTFAAMSYFAWERMVEAPEDLVFAGGLERAWIDERVAQRRLGDEALRRHSLRVGARAARALPDGVLQLDRRPGCVRPRLDPGRASDRWASTSRRRARSSSRRANRSGAEYVFTQPGIELAGRRVAEGTAARSRALADRRPRARRRSDVERRTAQGGLSAG